MIDKKPQVGRILMRESHMYFMFVRKGGVITKVSGKRVYYLEKDSYYGDQEKYVSTYSCVCDTEEEATMLMDHSLACQKEIKALEREHLKQFKELWS